MSENRIGQCIADQFDRVFSSLRDAIGKCPDDQWISGDVDWLIPARQAFHAVRSADFYRHRSREEFHCPIAGDWEKTPLAELPARPALLEYLQHTQGAMKQWLTQQSDEAILADEKAFPWTGRTILDRAVYALRHVEHHLAQINSELRRRNLPRGKWA